MTPLKFTHYNFHEWDIREVPAFWLAEMIESSGDAKCRKELDRRVAELHRQDELELVKEKRVDSKVELVRV